jgi:hypothetical protein
MTTVVQQRPVLEVADVLRTHGASYLDAQGPHLSRDQLRAVKELALCRTAALGGHTEHCGGCGTQRVSYNSCRNRHCPKCQASTRAAWLEREAQALLPVDYYHVVFTLPAALGPLALQNPRVLYDLLLRTAWETVRELASDPHYLGATVGLLAVLHTWGQTLSHHPHVHCVVTGGGLACDVNGRGAEPPRWLACRPGFFLPVRVLSRLFRGKFLAGLQAAYDGGQLGCHGRLAALAAPAAFAAWLTPLYRQEWVVYAKPPFGGPEQVLKYLARYTHRVAISNGRLVALDDDQVTFRYKDYADDRRHKTMALAAHEFIRRFLQHVLPSGFMKIRHYGLLANRYREANLRACRALLLIVTLAARLLAAGADSPRPPAPCPHCGGQDWRMVGHTPRPRVSEVCRLPLPQVSPPDSS